MKSKNYLLGLLVLIAVTQASAAAVSYCGFSGTYKKHSASVTSKPKPFKKFVEWKFISEGMKSTVQYKIFDDGFWRDGAIISDIEDSNSGSDYDLEFHDKINPIGTGENAQYFIKIKVRHDTFSPEYKKYIQEGDKLIAASWRKGTNVFIDKDKNKCGRAPDEDSVPRPKGPELFPIPEETPEDLGEED